MRGREKWEREREAGELGMERLSWEQFDFDLADLKAELAGKAESGQPEP